MTVVVATRCSIEGSRGASTVRTRVVGPCMQAPKPSANDLSPEEMQTVQLFLDNTPSVVNIANIGAADQTCQNSERGSEMLGTCLILLLFNLFNLLDSALCLPSCPSLSLTTFCYTVEIVILLLNAATVHDVGMRIDLCACFLQRSAQISGRWTRCRCHRVPAQGLYGTRRGTL